VAKKSGAERVLVARVQADGGILEAWGVDLDGLPLSSARERVPGALVQAALARNGPVYVRETNTAGGSGSRLAVASVNAVVVVEHRFVPGRFDAIESEEATRWATLAALALRLSPTVVETPLTDNAHTTVVPVGPRRSFPTIVGQSAALRRAVARLSAALDSELPVLIVGETGSGKELFARALHDHGPRSLRPFVAVNCAAIPEALFEAELFGHARGSFTGAERARPGLLAHAEGGTLFLDEIGELPLLRQAALLRALEARRYRPVGSDEERPFNVRVVAATNRDLERAVREGIFRQDLWYRLNAVEIRVPSLRERPEDIPLLVKGFLAEGASLTPEAMDALSAYEWPGNVRELEHHIVRLAGLGIERIEIGHLPRALRRNPPRLKASSVDHARAEILTALDHSHGNISHAARALGLTRQGLKKRMVRLGLREGAKKGQGS
jgi:two-component system response regulator HydG